MKMKMKTYLLLLHPHHRLMLLAVSLHLLLPHLPLLPQYSSMECWGVSDPVALNWYTLFRLIPLTLFVSRNLTLICLPFSGFLHSQLCNLIVPTPGLEFFLLMPHTLAAVSSFLSGRAYPSLNFLPSFFFCLTQYSDYVRVNISLYDSSSLSFLNVYAPPICSSPRDSRTDSFSLSILPIFRNLSILGDCNYHHPLWYSKGASDPSGKEVFSWAISSDLLNNSDIPTFLKSSSGSRSSLGISFAPSSLASGRCFRTWVLITYQFYKPSLFLRSWLQRTSPFLQFLESLMG